MTCPDWTRLTAHRLAPRLEDPAAAADGAPGADRAPAPAPDRLPEDPEAWAAALDHLEGCPECRRRAVAADPTLVFRSLPGWEPGAAEVDAMRAGVAVLRRARRVAPRDDGEGSARSTRRAGRTNAWRTAAAAVLAAALLSVAPAARRTPADPSRPVTSLNEPVLSRWEPLVDSTVDDIEHPTASVYHFDDEEVAVVMVVDAGLDV